MRGKLTVLWLFGNKNPGWASKSTNSADFCETNLFHFARIVQESSIFLKNSSTKIRVTLAPADWTVKFSAFFAKALVVRKFCVIISHIENQGRKSLRVMLRSLSGPCISVHWTLNTVRIGRTPQLSTQLSHMPIGDLRAKQLVRDRVYSHLPGSWVGRDRDFYGTASACGKFTHVFGLSPKDCHWIFWLKACVSLWRFIRI